MTMYIERVIAGRAFVDGELKYREVGIADGRIVTVGQLVRGGDERIELGTSQIMLPGFIDPHVHFRDPGMTQKETFGTGTLAAVHAGVTCVLDMPNTKPPVTDLQSLMDKKASVRGRANVDYGLFAAVTESINAASLAPLVPGFKLFMGSTTGNILLDEDDELAPAVSNALSTGKRVSVHAEDDHLILHDVEKCTRDHLRNRPAEAELNAIRRLASHFKGRSINICHLTTPEGLDLAKAAGFSTEVTMHHLTFDVDRHTDARYKVNPPVRGPENRRELYSRFLAGAIDMFGSDHAPHTIEDKEQEFDAAPSGIPGVETTMPMAMELVRSGDIPMQLAVSMGAENAGRLFSLRKGRIAEGYDADLQIYDMRKASQIDVRALHSKCGHSPYGGYRAVFPETVMVRGEVQVQDGEFCGEPIGSDVCGRLRSRLFRGFRKEGGMPQRVRDVLPLPAGGAPGGARVLPQQPSGIHGQDQGPRLPFRVGDEEGLRIVRVPEQQEMHRLRP